MACPSIFARNCDGEGVAIDLSFSHIPKVLSGCLHTICQSCAEEALQHSGDLSEIPCPLCGIVTAGISSTNGLTNNVIALQDIQRWSSHCNFCDDTVIASHRCLECESLLCAFHVEAHARSRATSTHKVFPLNARGVRAAAVRTAHHVPVFCPQHVGVVAKLFCSEPCGKLVCQDCSIAEHPGHKIFLANSEEVEVIHRTGLTQHVVNMGHR